MTGKRLIIGVDPGITGALALVQQIGAQTLLMAVKDMPVAQFRAGKAMKSHVIPTQVVGLLKEWIDPAPLDMPVDVFIEEVHAMPGQGVTSMFRFGHVAGLLEGVVAGLGLRLHKTPPREWQAIARVRKDPDAGRHRASELFPNLSAAFTRKMDHNRADAALIAYAGAKLLASPLDK